MNLHLLLFRETTAIRRQTEDKAAKRKPKVKRSLLKLQF